MRLRKTASCRSNTLHSVPRKSIPKILAKVVEKWLTQAVPADPGNPPVESAAAVVTPAPNPAEGAIVFNRELFLSRMMDDEGFAREIAAQLFGELPTHLMNLKEAVAQKNLESVWKNAHKLKGAAANVGGEALSAVASELEQAGKASDLARVVQLLPELETQTARLSEVLKQWTS